MGGVHVLGHGLLDLADHLVEDGQHLLVHLNHSGLSGAFGHVDQGQGASALFAEFGQKLWAGQEDWTCQACDGLRAVLL